MSQADTLFKEQSLSVFRTMLSNAIVKLRKYKVDDSFFASEYERLYLESIGESFNTFLDLCEKSKDISSALIILRSIADRLVIYKFIFKCADKDERDLRILLFALDSLSERLDLHIIDTAAGIPSLLKNDDFEKERGDWLREQITLLK